MHNFELGLKERIQNWGRGRERVAADERKVGAGLNPKGLGQPETHRAITAQYYCGGRSYGGQFQEL